MKAKFSLAIYILVIFTAGLVFPALQNASQTPAGSDLIKIENLRNVSILLYAYITELGNQVEPLSRGR